MRKVASITNQIDLLKTDEVVAATGYEVYENRKDMVLNLNLTTGRVAVTGMKTIQNPWLWAPLPLKFSAHLMTLLYICTHAPHGVNLEFGFPDGPPKVRK